jgi:hypothetical protein
MVIVTALVITSLLKQVQNVTWQFQLMQLLQEIWKLLVFVRLGECHVIIFEISDKKVDHIWDIFFCVGKLQRK